MKKLSLSASSSPQTRSIYINLDHVPQVITGQLQQIIAGGLIAARVAGEEDFKLIGPHNMVARLSEPWRLLHQEGGWIKGHESPKWL